MSGLSPNLAGSHDKTVFSKKRLIGNLPLRKGSINSELTRKVTDRFKELSNLCYNKATSAASQPICLSEKV